MKKRLIKEKARIICYNCSHAHLVSRNNNPIICQCLISDDGLGNYIRQVARYHSCDDAEPSTKSPILHTNYLPNKNG